MTNKFLPAALAAVAVAGGGAWYYMSAQGAAEQTAITAGAETSDAELDLDRVPDMSLGDPDAPVEMIEYASLTCPHCANFHADVLPDLKADYIDTGAVHYIHREVYFDRYGLWAAMIARCGGEGRYFGMLDMIYEGQSDWATRDDPAEAAEELRSIGRSAGISNDELEACLTDEAQAEAMIAAYEHYSGEHGIEATPTFIINGERYSNKPYSELAEVIDGKLDN